MMSLLKKIRFCLVASLALLALSCTNPFLLDAVKLYVVSFETNCDTKLDSYRTAKVKEIRTLEKNDADFAGWYTSASFAGGAVEFPYELTEDTTLYAKWNQKYLVAFETNGGSDVAAYKTSVIKDEPVTAKSDSVFAGWYVTQDCSGEAVSFPLTLTCNVTLYAAWRALPAYTATFVSNGGTAVQSVHAAVINEAPVTERSAYFFAGWFLDDVCTIPAVFPYRLGGDTVFYAKWDEKPPLKYTVEHYQQGTNLSDYMFVEAGTFYGAENSATKVTANTYAGFHAKDFSQEIIKSDGSTTVRIYYDRNKYTVCFDACGGGGSMGEQVFYYGVAQNLSRNAFTHSGYSFYGWADDGGRMYADGESVRNLSATDGAVVTLYALWQFMGVIVRDEDIADLDLSHLTGEYTVRVEGYITGSSLEKLARKIVEANKPITLDLSESVILLGITRSYFGACYNLDKLILPRTLDYIGSEAFMGCKFSYIKIYDDVKHIADYAFFSCERLVSVDLGNGVRTIGERAFSRCDSLESIVIPRSVESIGKYAFYSQYESALSSVEFVDTRTWNCFKDSASIYDVDVTDSAENARMLVKDYCGYSWQKNTY